MSKITTHILDTSLGKPASEVKASLFQIADGSTKMLAEGTTNDDGRITDLTDDVTLEAGVYELVFEVEAYFSRKQIESFYPSVTVRFRIEAGQHYHVPLLLNPFGYSTYRGS